MWNIFKKKHEPEILEVNLPKQDVKTIKSSRGIVEEASVHGTGFGDDYVDKIFQISGINNDKLWDCYWNNSWIRACIDKIIKEVCKYKIIVKPKASVEDKDSEEIQTKIKEIETLLANPNPKVESFDGIRRKYLRDILIYDAGALEIVKKSSESKSMKLKLTQKVKDLTTLTLEYKKDQKELNSKEMIDAREEITQLKTKIKEQEEAEKDKSNKPTELYDVAGDKIKLNIDTHGNFKEGVAYRLMYNQASVADFKIDELIYFIANPIAGSAYGISPLESVYNTVIADNQAAILNRRRLENDGMISGVLSFPGMSEKKLKANVMFWKTQAKTKAGRFVITSSPDVKFTKLTESPEEMQFMEYQRWILNKIMAVYGLQPIVLGIIDVGTGKLNSEEQRRQFKSDAIIPLLKLESHHLTDVLIRQGFGYDDIEIDYESPKQEIDLEKMSGIVEKIAKLGSVIRRNEARELIGLPLLDEAEGGDELIQAGKEPGTEINVEPGNNMAMLSQLDKIRERVETLFQFEDEPMVNEEAENLEVQLNLKKKKIYDGLLNRFGRKSNEKN